MVFYSVRQRLAGWAEAQLDTFLLRALFTLMLIGNSLPPGVQRSRNRPVYFSLIALALILTAVSYFPSGLPAMAHCLRRIFSSLAKAEYKVEFYVKAHHFALLFIGLALAMFAAKFFTVFSLALLSAAIGRAFPKFP